MLTQTTSSAARSKVRSLGQVFGSRIEGVTNSKLELVRVALRANQNVVQVAECGIDYRPGRSGHWAQTVDLWVAPLRSVAVSDLDAFAKALFPRLGLDAFDCAGSMSLYGGSYSTLYYDEDFGTAKSAASRVIAGLRCVGLTDSYDVQEAERLRRRTWVRVFSDRFSALQAVGELEKTLQSKK